jgi:hypothetical protein
MTADEMVNLVKNCTLAANGNDFMYNDLMEIVERNSVSGTKEYLAELLDDSDFDGLEEDIEVAFDELIDEMEKEGGK